MAGLGCFNERRWTTAGRSATAETRAGAASPRSPMPPNGRSSFTGTGGRPGARCLSSGTHTFRLHAAPLLDMPVDRITSADVLGCLAPIWTSKPAAARKARNRIAAVFRWCIGRNHRADNPVDRAVCGAAEGERPRAEALSRASAPGGCGGARGGLPRPCPEKPSRSGVSEVRPAGAPRRGPSLPTRARHEGRKCLE